jgi:hypothetical protein
MLPDPNYMASKQRDTGLNWEMRSILILWLVEVHNHLALRQEILFLAINYIDRFLSLKEVSVDRLQFVGVVAICIATKYEDDWKLPHKYWKRPDNWKHVTSRNFRELCPGSYTAEDYIKAEFIMLDKLQYKLQWPGPLIFLRRINIEIDGIEDRVRILAKYLVEAILPDKSFVAERPSITAAAAYCLARCMLERGKWVSSLDDLELDMLIL